MASTILDGLRFSIPFGSLVGRFLLEGNSERNVNRVLTQDSQGEHIARPKLDMRDVPVGTLDTFDEDSQNNRLGSEVHS